MNFKKKLDRIEMDMELKKAAKKGDVEFLKKAVAVQPPEYFLTQDRWGDSIFHIAVWEDNVEFIKEAMNILPTNILKQLLLTITNNNSYTPVHTAAVCLSVPVIKCIGEMYASLSWDDDEDHVKPWLALTKDNKTPLNLSLSQGRIDEEGTMEIMLMDPQRESWIIADKRGNTPIYHAVRHWTSYLFIRTRGEATTWNLVAEKILMSPLGPTSLVCSKDFSILYTKHSEKIVRLLKKCGYLDNDGNTPLHCALYSRSTEEDALQILSTHPALRIICNDKEESPFFLAVTSGCERVVDRIIRIEEPRFHMLRRSDGTTVLHRLSSCTEKTGVMLLEKFWWMIKLQDDQGKTALDYAIQEKTEWRKCCKEIKVDPYVRTTYILPETNLEQMRTTLSVIAALLATITFAAGNIPLNDANSME